MIKITIQTITKASQKQHIKSPDSGFRRPHWADSEQWPPNGQPAPSGDPVVNTPSPAPWHHGRGRTPVHCPKAADQRDWTGCTGFRNAHRQYDSMGNPAIIVNFRIVIETGLNHSERILIGTPGDVPAFPVFPNLY